MVGRQTAYNTCRSTSANSIPTRLHMLNTETLCTVQDSGWCHWARGRHGNMRSKCKSAQNAQVHPWVGRGLSLVLSKCTVTTSNMAISEWDCGTVQPCNGTLSDMEHCHIWHCKVIYVNHTGGAVTCMRRVHACVCVCVHVCVCVRTRMITYIMSNQQIMHAYTMSCTTPQLTAVLKLRSNPHWSTRYLITGRLPPLTEWWRHVLPSSSNSNFLSPKRGNRYSTHSKDPPEAARWRAVTEPCVHG